MTVAARGLVALLALLAAPRAASASQDDVQVPIGAPDALFGEVEGWLTETDGQADVGIYPVRGDEYHRWHGRVRGDMAIAQPTRDSLVRLGLSVQTVADDRNEIAFRLVRLYYDAFTGYERRLGPGVGYAGYRHRCSHGADSAVDGRVLIRSGPELGYRFERAMGAWLLRAHAFAMGSVISQNDDLDALPRALFGGAGELRLRAGWASWVLGVGFGAAIVSRWEDWTVTIADAWRGLKVEPLPTAAAGVVMHGERADFRILAHYQRILDSGVGATSRPQGLVAVQLGFVY